MGQSQTCAKKSNGFLREPFGAKREGHYSLCGLEAGGGSRVPQGEWKEGLVLEPLVPSAGI